MNPTVRDALALPVMRAGKPRVIGGHAHLDRPVRWAHVSESADLTDLLEGGELVLSTGLPLAGGSAGISAYLGMLEQQRVAGLVIELGTHLSDVPPQLSAHAAGASFPVVLLSAEIRFIEVTQQLHQLIVSDRYAEVEFARATHEVFTSLNLARASSDDIVARASELLSEPLVLEDTSRHVLAFCAAHSPPVQVLRQWADRSRRHDSADTDGAEGSSWTTVPLGVGAERWGRLVLPATPGDAARARTVLERAAQSLQLHRMIQQERDALVVQALGGLLDDLLSGRVGDDEARARAEALGLATGARYVPLVVRAPRRTDTDALTQGEADRRILTAVRAAVGAAHHTAIVSLRREGSVFALLACPDPRSTDRVLDDVCARIDGLAGRHGPSTWVAGTAPASASLTTAAGGLAEAGHVADVGITLPQQGRLYRSTDVRLRGLLSLMREDHRVQAFAETELGRLLDHDTRTGEALLPLLRTHLSCGGYKARTARETGLSRPTLYGRLRTAERILGVSLESAESRTSLHTALMILDTR